MSRHVLSDTASGAAVVPSQHAIAAVGRAAALGSASASPDSAFSVTGTLVGTLHRGGRRGVTIPLTHPEQGLLRRGVFLATDGDIRVTTDGD